MKRLLSILVLLVIELTISINNAQSFFTDEYKKNLSYGAFKQINNADAYLGLNVGFMAKTWTPNLSTMLTPNKSTLAEYSNLLGDQLFVKTSDYYTYYLGIVLGLHHQNSAIRHELELNWYGIIAKPMTLSGDSLLSRNIGDISYTYGILNNNYVISVGVYSNIYRLLYSCYAGIDNVFTFIGIKWDLFAGLGAGFALVSGGTYAGEQLVLQNQTEQGNVDTGMYEYKNNKISSASSVGDSKLFSSTNFAIAYQAKIGILSNISQSFATSISAVFGATSRPLLTTRFRYIDKIEGSNTHLEYHVALEVAILLKSFELAL